MVYPTLAECGRVDMTCSEANSHNPPGVMTLILSTLASSVLPWIRCWMATMMFFGQRADSCLVTLPSDWNPNETLQSSRNSFCREELINLHLLLGRPDSPKFQQRSFFLLVLKTLITFWKTLWPSTSTLNGFYRACANSPNCRDSGRPS